MITGPLDLKSRLSPPPRDLDFFAWVNVGVIVLFFGLLGSRFVLLPGEPVGVSSEGILLPEISNAVSGAVPASVVVSVRRDNVILFEGGMYSAAEMKKRLQAYAAEHPKAVLLVRADRQVSMQAFLQLCETAREVGFAKVLAAAEQPSN